MESPTNREPQKPLRFRSSLRVALVSLVVAWCGAAGASYVLGQGEAAFGPLVTGAITLVGAVFFACLYILAELRYAAWLARPAEAAARSRAFPGRFCPRWSRRSVALFAGIMALCWLPWLIANYPGGAYWDTYYQIWQVFPENHPISIIPFGDHAKDTVTSAYFCDHHPLLDTLVYGGFAAASQALTGAWNAGTFAFVILQGAGTIIALTASLAFLRKLGAPHLLCFLGFAYFCLMPFISTWAMTMVKDSLFSLVFIPYFMQLANACATRGRSLARPRAAALFIVLGVLLCLTKKTGLYVVLATAVLAIILLLWNARKRKRMTKGSGAFVIKESAEPQTCSCQTCLAPSAQTKSRLNGCLPDKSGSYKSTRHMSGDGADGMVSDKPTLYSAGPVKPCHLPRPLTCALACIAPFAAQAAACLLVMQFLLPWVVFPALDVAPGGRQEALGPLIQQTAAFVHDYRDEVTPEEMRAIDGVVPYGRVVDEYNPTCQDDVKYCFRIDASSEAIDAYLRAWAEMGLRHPETYLAATLAIGGSYLAPVQSLNIRSTTCDTWMGDVHVLYNPPELDWLREGMAGAYEAFANTPVACLPVQAVVWVFWLPALLWLIARRFHPGDGLLFAPGAVILAFCVIGPIFDARYCLPLLYTVPLLTCFVFRESKGQAK